MTTKKLRGIIFLVAGIAALIFAFMSFGAYNGGYESYHTYGGDAYTGIQNSAAATANNVSAAAGVIASGFGYAFLVVALLLIGEGVVCFISEKKAAAPAVPTAPVAPYAAPYAEPAPYAAPAAPYAAPAAPYAAPAAPYADSTVSLADTQKPEQF